MPVTVRIFLSYDDTCRDVAQRIALGLRGAGHRVFFDQDSLPAGTSYDERIRDAIGRSHFFVFLVNAESIRIGAYALTELSIAEQRWAHPDGRVLPVLLDDTPIVSLPPYLRAVSVLIPKGDVVADTLVAVVALVAERRKRLARRGVAWVAAIVAAVAMIPFVGSLRGGAGGVVATPDSAVDSTAEHPAPDSVPVAQEDERNSRTWKLKNDRHVRLVGTIVSNRSNVADVIVEEGVEWGAWRYNRCYDDAYGHLAGELPEGAVVVAFEISDQLPRAATVQRSDFQEPEFDECVVGTLLGQTLNAAGATGAGPVSYSFRFLPN